MFEYYVNYNNRARNCYGLFCVDRDNSDFFRRLYPEAERVTRREAVRLARAERERRRNNPAFAGYANTYIMPFPGAWCTPDNAYLHVASDGVTVYPTKA